ncbi:enoyl-CoA hydratase/isomerase family protein [Psychrobacillus soli]|uniref:enoyl-CoA hydratase/isomerase family protein n=1 Tax=Psychrobacillus soli TaxID=1543965 RepID=UPI00163C5265|nr:enoyl-CoA hydratase/isomerase family protein [Psychrobacillus soli]
MSKIQVDIQGDGIAILTLNYPEKRNVLSSFIMKELNDQIKRLYTMKEKVKVLIIRSEYPAFFSSGGDIKEWHSYSKSEAYDEGTSGSKIFSQIENSPFITIASISGTCLGGGSELALSCDLRICTEDAVFGQPEVILGNGPSWGGYYRLARTIGVSKAKEWILLGENYSAKQAEQCGYVHKVTRDTKELQKTTHRIARQLASNFQAAKVSKLILNQIEEEMVPTNVMVDALSASIFAETELSITRKKAFLDKRLNEVIVT